MQGMRAECAKQPPEHYGECLVMRMPSAGASPAAVAFTDELKKLTGQLLGKGLARRGVFGCVASVGQALVGRKGPTPFLGLTRLRALPKTPRRCQTPLARSVVPNSIERRLE